MKVQCVICDQIEDIDRDSVLGKKLRNHPLATYMCTICRDRIADHTEKRRAEGKLPEPVTSIENEKW